MQKGSTAEVARDGNSESKQAGEEGMVLEKRIILQKGRWGFLLGGHQHSIFGALDEVGVEVIFFHCEKMLEIDLYNT